MLTQEHRLGTRFSYIHWRRHQDLAKFQQDALQDGLLRLVSESIDPLPYLYPDSALLLLCWRGLLLEGAIRPQ